MGEFLFVVTEHFAGGNLRDVLLRHVRLSGNDIRSIACQIADAVDFAHTRNVICKHLRPENIWLEAGPQRRVAIGSFIVEDILNAWLNDNLEATMTSDLLRNFEYFPPETIESGVVTPATDIYAFGVILYEMIAGCTPFHDRTERFISKMREGVVDIRKYVSVPDELAARLSATLSREPNLRPPSARAVLHGIENQLSSL